MARTRIPQPTPPNGFVASAVGLPTMTQNAAAKPQGWQNTAWSYYDTVSELRYIATWIGNVMSRAKLVAAKRDGDNLTPLTEGPAFEAMEALYGGPQGQEEMLQLIGCDLTVGGEGYLSAASPGGKEQWNILTTGKVSQSGGGKGSKVTLDLGGDHSRYAKKPSDLLIRIWTPHPRDAILADAPTRSNLRTLAQINGYDDHISAQLTSRLAGAGVFMLPSEIEFAKPEGSDPSATQADVFMATLHEAMMAPIEDRSNPAALVPIVVTAPGDMIDKAQLIQFWTELDSSVIEMRESAIKRFAIGMDVPPEVLLGNGEANHWNAWLSQETAIKAHLEPRLGVVSAALTPWYLRPAIEGDVPDNELDDYYVIADTSGIRVRPDRSSNAIELGDKGMLGPKAVLRETGFDPDDAPTEEEYNRWLLQRVATGAVTPEITAAALRALGVNDMPVQLQDNGAQQPPDHTRVDTDVPRVADGPPEMPDGLPLVAACEVLVFRALERAGNVLRNRMKGRVPDDVPAHQVYLVASGDPTDLLSGSWTIANDVLAFYDVDPAEVIQTLDFYAGGLLKSQRPHSRHTLELLLRSWNQSPLALASQTTTVDNHDNGDTGSG